MGNIIKERLEMINQQMQELKGIYRGAISNFGISENEFWIWYVLINVDVKLSQQDICGLLSFSKQTVNNIISNMVKDNYITLEVVPGTRNRKNIHLTEEGRKFGESIIIPISDAEARAFERIPMEERIICLAVLEKYTRLLKEEIYAANVCRI